MEFYCLINLTVKRRNDWCDEQKAELKGFGDSVLVINNTIKFFARVETAFKK